MSIIALLADVHANLVALEAVLAALPPVDRIWVMGDTVGYGPDPSDVLTLLREKDALVVAGNHDLAAATGEGIDLFNHHAAAAVRLHRSWLSPEERDRLASLPLTAEADGFTLCHGSLRDPIWEYVMSQGQAATTLALARTAHCCNGHKHVPRIFRVGDRMLVNPGSVGQPRDGDPRAAYAVLDTGTAAVTLERVAYDAAETQRRIRRRGLPDFLAERLAIGF
jgi:putative phosphoesterase